MERHHHRYGFNNACREDFQKAGLKISGGSKGGKLVEIVELEDPPWFVASQFHPEFKSKPDRPHPLFRDFVKSAVAYGQNRKAGLKDAEDGSQRQESSAMQEAR